MLHNRAIKPIPASSRNELRLHRLWEGKMMRGRSSRSRFRSKQAEKACHRAWRRQWGLRWREQRLHNGMMELSRRPTSMLGGGLRRATWAWGRATNPFRYTTEAERSKSIWNRCNSTTFRRWSHRETATYQTYRESKTILTSSQFNRTRMVNTEYSGMTQPILQPKSSTMLQKCMSIPSSPHLKSQTNIQLTTITETPTKYVHQMSIMIPSQDLQTYITSALALARIKSLRRIREQSNMWIQLKEARPPIHIQTTIRTQYRSTAMSRLARW